MSHLSFGQVFLPLTQLPFFLSHSTEATTRRAIFTVVCVRKPSKLFCHFQVVLSSFLLFTQKTQKCAALFLPSLACTFIRICAFAFLAQKAVVGSNNAQHELIYAATICTEFPGISTKEIHCHASEGEKQEGVS